MTKRRQISLLPQVHQTDALQRFFDSTVDQVFQDGKTVPVSGFIGRKPPYYDPAKDFYKPEPTAARERYQLEPVMISKDDSGNVLSQLFYEDLLARLGQDGALTGDPQRLFTAGYYSWAPPIDIDRIMNFQQYYWAGNTRPLEIVVPGVEVGSQTFADGVLVHYPVPETLPSRSTGEEHIVVLVDGVMTTAFTRSGDVITMTSAPPKDSLVTVYRYGNVANGTNDTFAIPIHALADQNLTTVYVFLNGRETTEFTINDDTITLATPPVANTHVMVTRIKDLRALIEGHTQFDPTGLNDHGVTELIDGMKIKLIDPQNFAVGFDLKAYGFPWDELHYSTFFVEGADVSISLVPLDNVSTNDTQDYPKYIVVARKDASGSYWSRINRWVHKDALIFAEDGTYENRAKRPIIEFLENVQQFNYGNYRVANTSCMVSDSPIYDGGFIDFTQINGLPEGSVTVDGGYRVGKGDVIAVNLPNTELNNKLYFVDAVVPENDSSLSLYLLEPLATIEEGAISLLRSQEYWFDGRFWNEVAEPGDYPVFDLYDADGISLSDTGVYPDTTFAGSRLFNFEVGTGTVDTELNVAVTYDKYGQINFENELETKTYSYRDGDITGYHYYRRAGSYENMWHRAGTDLQQQIDDNNVSEIPLNLQANPDFDSPTILSRNDFFAHFSSIISNQDGFTGQAYARNNWYLTAKDVTKGLIILQHEAPMLKLMAIMQERSLSMVNAIRFADREYARLKANFLKHVVQIAQEVDADTIPSEALAEMALARVNAGKTSSFPFSDSTIGGANYFIPLTPALLGISPLVSPEVFVDDTFGSPISFTRGHDGSATSFFNDVRDGALLALETMIYRNARAVTELMPLYDIVSGKSREATYSEAELAQIMSPMFEGWARDNNITLDNTIFDEANPFTWNYSSCTDRYGNDVLGGWRGIYRHYFDTDRPHIAPWEMLGFAQMPSWWTQYYGPAPYTRSNTILWSDVAAGIIRDGDRTGTYAKFARPELMQILPVDLQGNLIDPVTATLVLRKPPVQFARDMWRFGDGSNAEAVWRNTSSYQFSLAMAKFLMRPNFFVERFWDRLGERTVYDQIVDATTLVRNHHRDIYVNREVMPDGQTKVTQGVQNWIIDTLINRGLAPVQLGTVIRGLSSQLGHKVAGFTTTDRMTVTAESFGLVPSEDISVTLYQSPNLDELFYSGLVIENAHLGWRVVGYDAINPSFSIIPGDLSSRKVKISNSTQVERVVNPWTPSVYYKVDMRVEYRDSVYRCITPHTSGQKFEAGYWEVDTISAQRAVSSVYRSTKAASTVEKIPYGTQLNSKQDVADLLFGIERYLVSQGFVFAENDDDVSSWTTAVRNFLKWSDVEWAEGAFVALSPSARELTFRSPTGIITNLSNAIVGRTGHTLKKENYAVDRYEDTTVITASAEDIYGARLLKTEIEHCLVFSNKTIFDDVIYDALYNIRQDRLKISARLAGEWNGRYYAPGFVLQGNDITPNFVKLGEDIREMFDIELADNTVLRDHARHVIGFETRDYLDELLMNETQQFELYQGMIQQKGSKGALGSILRSDQIGQNRDLEFLEEWAFRLGEFGAFNPSFNAEFIIRQGDIHADPQIAHFGSTSEPNWIDLTGRWISSQTNFTDLLVTQTRYSFADAGFARLDEAEYFVRDIEALITLFQTRESLFEGERVWVTHTPAWDVGRLCYPSADHLTIGVTLIDDELTGASDNVEDYRVWFDRNHDLSVGDFFYLTGGDTASIRGGYEVLRSGDNWVETTNLTALIFNEDQPGEVPVILRMESMRVAGISDLTSIPYGNGTTVYVDNVGGKWAVYQKLVGDWAQVRRQGKYIENGKVTSAVVYDSGSVLSKTALSVEPRIAEDIIVIDPMAGIIPGVADRELDYRVEYDPADYRVWGLEEVGTLWWDTSTTKFINCYTDAVEEFASDTSRYVSELNYRSANWGKIMPTSSVDVYEWTRSTTAPADLLDFSTHQEFDAGLNQIITAYYYWSLNPSTTPRLPDRRLSALSVSQIIQNPSIAGLIWVAGVAPMALLVNGLKPYLSDTDKVLQIKHEATDYQGDEHSEWLLMRPKDKSVAPDSRLWSKLLTSLRGFNDDFNALPSTDIHFSGKSGLRDNQSMFGDTEIRNARKSFFTMLNFILARKNLSTIGLLDEKLGVADTAPAYVNWSSYTTEPGFLPLSSEYDFVVFSEEELPSACASYERVLLDNRHGDIPSYSVWTLDTNGHVVLAPSYHHVVDTIEERDALFSTLRYKDTVMVRHDSRADGFWTIWRKDGEGAWAIDPFETFPYDAMAGPTLSLANAQKYRTQDMWFYADWYSSTVTSDFPPSVTYANVAARTAEEGNSPLNELVKITDDGGYWSWTQYINGEWVIVARENGTIQLKDDFYTSNLVYGFANGHQDLNITNISARNGVLDIEPLVNALVQYVLTPEDMNELWFSMIHYIHSTQDKIDWASKTSFLSVLGFNERLWQSPVEKTDNTPLLLDYIDEVKPYRVKVREVLQTAAPDIDLANGVATDFDKPVYYDPALDAYRRLDDEIDAAILETGVYRHRHLYPEQVRKTKIGILFDRIWDQPSEGSGAAARIMAYYQPGSNMRAKSLPDLFNLDFQGTVYDGKTFEDIEKDIILRGAPKDQSQKDINSPDGLRMRDPRSVGKPEELIKFAASDGLVIRVHDQWGKGAPMHTVRHYDVSRRRSATASFDINVLADSVAVFRDGVRAPTSAYTFNPLTHSVDVQLTTSGPRVKTIAIHAFGFAAVDQIKDQRYYSGADSFDLPNAFSGLVEANINGTPVDNADISVDLNTVTLTAHTDPNDAVMLTLYSTEDPKPIRQHVTPLTYNADQVWTLIDKPSQKPYCANMIVEVNGLRLTPSKTFYASDELAHFVGTSTASHLKVYDDRTASYHAVVDISTISTDVLAEPTDVITLMGSTRFALWNQHVVFADEDASGRDYVIVLDEGNDFTISDSGSLQITSSLSNSDTISVTHWINADIMDVRTNVYHGATNGIYTLQTKKNGRSWLTVAGRRLVENVDYTIRGIAGSAWDVDPFETFTYDTAQTVQIALNLPGQEDSVDVVITTFEGRENNAARTWQLSTVAPEEMRMLPVSQDETPMYMVRKAWEIIALDGNRRSGALTGDLAQEADTIAMTLNPLAIPEMMLPTQPMQVPNEKTPGVIWIDGERIEYFEYSRGENIVTLGQLRRGTKGTPKLVHADGSMIYAGDAILDRLPPCPLGEEIDGCGC